MNTRLFRIIILIFAALITIGVIKTYAILPGDINLLQFEGASGDDIDSIDGTRFQLVLRVELRIKGDCTIEEWVSDLIENHMFMERLTAGPEGTDTTYWPCYSGVIRYLPVDTLPEDKEEIEFDSTRVYYYQHYNIATPLFVPHYDTTTYYFYVDDKHWIQRKDGPSTPPYFQIGKTFGDVDSSYKLDNSKWIDPGEEDLMQMYNLAPVRDKITLVGKERPGQIPPGRLEFIRYSEENWLPTPLDTIFLVFAYDDTNARHIRYNLCFISDYWGEYMNDPYYDAPTVNELGGTFDLMVVPYEKNDTSSHRVEIVDTVGFALDPFTGTVIEKKFNTVFAYTTLPDTIDSIQIACRDYGAHGLLWVGRPAKGGGYPDPDELPFQHAQGDGDTTYFVPIPQDYDGFRQIGVFDGIQPVMGVGDGMADSWEQEMVDWYNNKYGTDLKISEVWPVYEGDTTGGGKFKNDPVPTDQDPYPTGSDEFLGDGLNVFEEYRGFLIADSAECNLNHLRTNPFMKTGFISVSSGDRFSSDYGLGYSETGLWSKSAGVGSYLEMNKIIREESILERIDRVESRSPGAGKHPVVNCAHIGSYMPINLSLEHNSKIFNHQGGTVRWRRKFAPSLYYDPFDIHGEDSDNFGLIIFNRNCENPLILQWSSEDVNYIFVNVAYIESRVIELYAEKGITWCHAMRDSLVSSTITHEIGHVYGIPHWPTNRIITDSTRGVHDEWVESKYPGTLLEYWFNKRKLVELGDTSVMVSLDKTILDKYGVPRMFSSYDASWIWTNKREPKLSDE